MFLAASQDDEMLPTNPFYPADLFTACLTTPLRVAVLHYIQNSLLMDWDPQILERIPGVLNNRRTPLGELNWIFTAITDSIAWNVLPRGLLFYVLWFTLGFHKDKICIFPCQIYSFFLLFLTTL